MRKAIVTAAAAGALVLTAAPVLATPVPAPGESTNPDSGPTAGPAVSGTASAAPSAAAGPRSSLGGDQLSSTGVVTNSTVALPPDLSAASWLVADLDTGAVLGAKDPHAPLLPASTLKTLTALTLLPKIDLAMMITPTDADARVDGTRVGLVPGEPYSADELFHAMLLGSANDAAEALSHAVETREQTLADMNAEAVHLQADDTLAGTPSGLDTPDEHSSSYDLALIARAGLQLPAFAAYVQTPTATLHNPKGKPLTVSNHNNVIRSYPGAIGVKNGYTVAAGHCLVEAATKDGRRVIIVIMKGDGYQPYTESIHLLDWGFATLTSGVMPVGQLVDPLPDMAPAKEVAAAPSPARVTGPTHRARASAVPRDLLLGVLTLAPLAILLRRRRNRTAASSHLASLRHAVTSSPQA